MSVSAQKTVRVATFDADDAARTLAADLARAVADAIAKVPTVRGVKEGGDLCLDGQVRASQNRVRVRLRLTDSAGEVVWVDKVEGALDDPFALEDTIAACATRALGARGARASGPEGPARERYEEARVLLEEIVDLGALGKAAALLEALDAEYPNDAWIMSLLAYALVMVENTRGALDDAVYGRAEELALRALDRDPSIGQTYYAIAVVRLHTGDARAALEAAREALRRAPMLAQAHALVGSILVQAGRLAEGMQRLDVAIRLAPKMLIAHTDRIHALALMGDRAAAEREVARLADRLGPIATIGAKLRLCCWWSDRAMAADLATLLPQQAAGMWSTALPFLKAYAAGKELEFAPLVDRMFVGLTSARVAPRHRAMMHRIAAENAMLLGRRDMALDQIAAGALLPTFIDLVWLDRCPNLTPLRDEPRFAETRAIVAERVARVVGD
jgi:serine/threonine-protein kinase